MAEKTTKKNKWQKQYDNSKANLAKLKLDLANLYTIKDLENREYQLKVLKEQYGMDLAAYHQLQVGKLEEAKKILTSRYVIESPNPGMKPEYTSNASDTRNTYVMGANVNVEYGTTLNPDYDETLDLKSEYHVKKRLKDGGTWEEDFETQKQNEFAEAFNYGTAGNTDAWGRDYDHPDYGIDPSLINRTIVTPTPVNTNNNNNKKVITDTSEVNADTTKSNEVVTTNTINLGAKDGDLVAVNSGKTPNRLELMTESIRDNPSRIQKGLIGDDPTTGWTPERLAKLKIDHQDWKKNRKNRNTLKAGANT